MLHFGDVCQQFVDCVSDFLLATVNHSVDCRRQRTSSWPSSPTLCADRDEKAKGFVGDGLWRRTNESRQECSDGEFMEWSEFAVLDGVRSFIFRHVARNDRTNECNRMSEGIFNATFDK
jgi:hypothetical protein